MASYATVFFFKKFSTKSYPSDENMCACIFFFKKKIVALSLNRDSGFLPL